MFRCLVLALAASWTLAISACAPPSAPARMQPDAIGQHVVSLLNAGRIEDAQLWYFRGAFRAFVWDGLYDDGDVADTFSHRVAMSPNRQRVGEIEPDTAAKLLADAIAWDAATPPDFATPPAPEKLAKLPELRKDVAAWMADGIAEEKTRQAAARQADTEIAEGRPTSEAIDLISAERSTRAIPLGSFRVGCNDNHFSFPTRFTGAAPATASGGMIALEARNEVLILDGKTGRVLQKAPLQDFRTSFVTADGEDLRLIGFSPRVGESDASPIRQMTAASAPSPFDLPLPKEIGGRSFRVSHAAGSADGRLGAVEFCVGNGCNLFAAYDLKDRRIVWQGANTPGRSRLIWHIAKIDGRAVLVSELRGADSVSDTGKGELIDLQSGAVREIAYADLPRIKAELNRSFCHLENVKTPTGDEYHYRVFWPDGGSFDLTAPARASITDCAVSADGSVLLVATPPFLHSFTLRR